MKSKLPIVALCLVTLLLCTACPGPGPEPKPDNGGVTALTPESNPYIHQYNVCQGLLGLTKKEVETNLIKEGFFNDSTGNGEYTVRENPEDGSSNYYRNITVKYSAAGRVYYIKTTYNYYGPRTGMKWGLDQAKAFPKAFGEKRVIAAGASEVEFANVVDYNSQKSVTGFDTAMTAVDALIFDQGDVHYDNQGFTAHWGEGLTTRCEAAGTGIEKEAEAGTITAFAFFNLEMKLQEDSDVSTSSVMVFGVKELY